MKRLSNRIAFFNLFFFIFRYPSKHDYLKPHQKLYVLTASSVIVAVLLWTLLFYNDQHIHSVLPDVHTIYLSTLLCYLLIKLTVKNYLLDFIKILVRTLFRVWLLIFITLAIVKSMDRTGLLLSITFLLGYFEGCMDTDKWIQQQQPFGKLLSVEVEHSKLHEGLMTLTFMSFVHVFCALIVFAFSKYYM